MAKSRNSKLCKVGDSYTVGMETGEAVPVEGGGLRMLPGPPGACEWCHVGHDPRQPHNQQSLSYQMKFHAVRGRWPTWTDAMEHCSSAVKSQWRSHLRRVMAENGMEIPSDLQE